MGRNDAVGEVPRAAGVEQQAHLGLFPLEHLVELLVGQQVLLPQLLPAKGGHQLHHPAHKLPRRIPGGVDEHGVQLVGLKAQHLAHGIEQQLLLEDHNDLLPLLVPLGAVDQAVVHPLAELLPAVGAADGLGFQLEHVEHQLDDHLFQRLQLLLRQQVPPLAAAPAGDGLVLRQRVADEPPRAHAQEMVHRIRVVIRLLQLLLQHGQRILPEFLVDMPVRLQPLVADGGHIGLLVLKMLRGVALEVFHALLARPAAFLLPVLKKPVDDFEKPLVFLVDGLHADVETVLPD